MYDALPKEILHIILDYSGKIKYRKGIYINCIDKADERYSIIVPVIAKKLKVLKTIVCDKVGIDGFYLEFRFDKKKNMGLCIASGGWSSASFSQSNKIEICYFIFSMNVVQHRTYK